jgi:cyclase
MTVKGVNFVNIQEVGDAVELGAEYARQGADELVFLDITASHEGRKTFVDLVKRIARNVNIPFTVGGGISDIKDIGALLAAGADKVSINSAAIRNPDLIDQMARNFGSQFVVVAIDAKDEDNKWTAYINGGRIPTGKELYSWAKEAESRGAGEILFTSMNHDGTKNGFACDALAKLSENLSIPVIASGGAGTMEHYAEVFTKGKADAGLAASIFHFKEITVPQLKEYLHGKGIAVRL